MDPKNIVPFMNLSMAVGKSERAGLDMIDGRSIIAAVRLVN